jgi:hypothetical protein
MPPERLHPFDLPIQRILVDLETRLPPWMKLVSQSDSDTAFSRLTSEIIAFADLVSPTSKERLVRQDIIDRLQSQVRKVWADASVVPIGSHAQELYTSARYHPSSPPAEFESWVDVGGGIVIWIYLCCCPMCRTRLNISSRCIIRYILLRWLYQGH